MLREYKRHNLPCEDVTVYQDGVMDVQMVAERCISHRHDSIISKQKEAIRELRNIVSSLDELQSAQKIPNFALQRITSLKKANEELERKLANEINCSKQDLLDVTDQKIYNEVCRLKELLVANDSKLNAEKATSRQIQYDLHRSEETYFKTIRQINTECGLQHVFGLTPLTDGTDREDVLKNRNKGVEVIVNHIKSFKARIQRQEELLGNYDRDMKALRELETSFSKTNCHVKYLEIELQEKGDEISYLQEALSKCREECADLKRTNTALRGKKKFSMDYRKSGPDEI